MKKMSDFEAVAVFFILVLVLLNILTCVNNERDAINSVFIEEAYNGEQ